MSVPKPSDPRTPLQAARDKLAAASRTLACEHPPFEKRLELADKIRELEAEIRELVTTSRMEIVGDELPLALGMTSGGKSAALLNTIVRVGRKTAVYDENTALPIGHTVDGKTVYWQYPSTEGPAKAYLSATPTSSRN